VGSKVGRWGVHIPAHEQTRSQSQASLGLSWSRRAEFGLSRRIDNGWFSRGLIEHQTRRPNPQSRREPAEARTGGPGGATLSPRFRPTAALSSRVGSAPSKTGKWPGGG